MLPASNRGAGMNLGFPDVCNVPTPAGPVPTPFPNIAMNAQAMPFSLTTKINMMNALNLGSKIPMTSGDEAGSASPIKGMGAYTQGSPNVKIDSMPAITLACPTTGNNMNNGVGMVTVPSAVNVRFSYRAADVAGVGPAGADPYTRQVGSEELAALHEALRTGASRSAEPVTGAMLPGGIGHVTVALFTVDLPTRLYNEVRRLSALGMEALLLDLRGNPGGDVDAALHIAADFLAEGAELARAVDVDGDVVIHRAHEPGAYTAPVVVLVDGATASAAEILAGALQAHGRALVVGERTYGKGLGQSLVPATEGPGIFCATDARYLLPGGAEIEGVGIHPDIPAPPPAAAQLHAAWELASARRPLP